MANRFPKQVSRRPRFEALQRRHLLAGLEFSCLPNVLESSCDTFQDETSLAGVKTAISSFVPAVTPVNNQPTNVTLSTNAAEEIVAGVDAPPTSISISTASIREHIAGESVGVLSVTDQDAGQAYSFSVSDPRFEIVGETLKLKTNEFLELAEETTVRIDISATDNGLVPRTLSQTIVLNVMPNPHPWQNSANNLDTDNDPRHIVAPIDALLIINELNDPVTTFNSLGQLPPVRPAGTDRTYLDTNGDGFVSPIDVLLVINELNRQSEGEGELVVGVSAEGVPSASSVQAAQVRPTVIAESLRDYSVLADNTETRRIERLTLVPRSAESGPLAPQLEDVLVEIAEDVARNWNPGQ